MTTLRMIVAAMTLSTSMPVWAQEEGEEITDPVVIEYGGRRVPIYPAFEDYSYMLWDVCDGMKVPRSTCNQILPMNGDLGGNAIATIVEGNAVIVYDRTLSSDVGYAGAQAIIAHELGHFICGHLGKRQSQAQELEADRFAGAAMRASGQDLAGTLDMAAVLDERESHSHPGRAKRIEALKAGWSDPEAAKTCQP